MPRPIASENSTYYLLEFIIVLILIKNRAIFYFYSYLILFS